MEQVGYQIVHSIAGRIRIRVPWLESDSQASSNYQRLIEGLSDVKTVRISPLAQSIVVEYNARAISTSKMAELMISLMQQVKLTPPADAPTVEQDPSSEPATSESYEVSDPEPNSEPSDSTESTPSPSTPTQTSVEQIFAPLHSESKRVSIPEIPSPWDEDIAGQSATSTPEEPESPTIDTSKAVPNCSTASLAKRLKVTSQAITRRRTKSDFEQWTQAQDPEGIAWHYDEHDCSFRPVVSTSSQKKE
ncbi:hypothetical protein H6F89_20475 [Cyanobacteria bacterium FACHB-63]|nr:hypothetical protein [Cyanobacteria bacterium FACHB-63]